MVVGTLLMVTAATSAGVLSAFGRDTVAGTAWAIALASSFPVLAGAVTISPRAGHRLLRIGLAAGAVVALLTLALSRTGAGSA